MRIILIKLTLYLTEKCQKKKKIHRLISWQNPVKIKINIPKNSDKFNPAPAAKTAGPCPTIINCYCNSTTMYRRNGNCVDPNHTDS